VWVIKLKKGKILGGGLLLSSQRIKNRKIIVKERANPVLTLFLLPQLSKILTLRGPPLFYPLSLFLSLITLSLFSTSTCLIEHVV